MCDVESGSRKLGIGQMSLGLTLLTWSYGWPRRLPPLVYPAHFETRYVSANGGIRWNRRWVNVSVTCIGEYVGLEEVDDGIWAVYFGPLKLGRLLEQHLRIEDAHGRLRRHRVLPMSPD